MASVVPYRIEEGGRPVEAWSEEAVPVEGDLKFEQHKESQAKGFIGLPTKQQRDRALDDYISLFVDRPCTCCWVCGGVMFVLMIVSVLAGFMTIEQKDGAWNIIDGEATQSFVAFGLAQDAAEADTPAEANAFIANPRRRLSEILPGRDTASLLAGRPASSAGRRLKGAGRRLVEDGTEDYGVMIFYKSDKDGVETIFTPQRLQDICKLEKEWLSSSDFKALNMGEVEVYNSVLNFFYSERSSDGDFTCELLDEADVTDKVETMKRSAVEDGPRSMYARFVHPDFVNTGKSSLTMTYVSVKAEEDIAPDVTEPLMTLLGREYGYFRDGRFFSSAFLGDEDRFVSKDSIRVRVVNEELAEVDLMATPDFTLAFVSIILVFAILAVYLRSVFLATCGMFQIIASIPIASIIYRGLSIDYFEFLHILVVYLVLGIGADDIFVLIDTFRHISDEMALLERPGRIERDMLHAVLKKTWIRAASAIFNTSFTTAMAFMSCSGSEAMPMRTCGWYAAIAILLNYLFTITFTPSFLVIWHQRIQGKRCCCPKFTLRDEGMRASNSSFKKEKVKNIFEVFLERGYIPAMNWKVGPIRPVALAVVIIMGVVAVQGAYYASILTPPRKAEVWFPQNHMQMDVSEFIGSNFYQPDYKSYTVMPVVWGISGLDTSGIDAYNPGGEGGKVEFDHSFDLSTPEAQAHVLETCNKLITLPCNLDGCLKDGATGTLKLQTDKKSYSCILEDFQEWNGGTLPTGAEFLPKLLEFRDTADPADYVSEVLIDEVDFKTDIGVINGELKYFVVKIRSSVSEETPFSTGDAVKDLVLEFLEERKNAAPASMKSIRTAVGIFSEFDLSWVLLEGLFQGCAIAVPIAFLVLLSSTRNLIISVYAVVSVASIVLCVLGFCKSAMDWDLGIGEAVAGVIVIGYSVDYVVHLAHIYCEAAAHGIDKREERAEFAVRNMGSTVFAGSITTAGSAMVMFLCFFYFFIKMAVLIVITIMYSFLFSLGFFMSLAYLIGPEGACGNLPKIRRFCGGKEETDAVTTTVPEPERKVVPPAVETEKDTVVELEDKHFEAEV